jgi:predicted TPR repeat methyltransferase
LGLTPVNRSSGDLMADRRLAMAEAYLAEGDATAATDLLRQAMEIAPAWTAGWFRLGEMEETSANAPAAIEAFGRALALDPDDALGAGIRLARLGARPADTAMSPRFVAALFDQYADRFDDHLVNALGYSGPAIIADAIRQACAAAGRPFHFDAALDVGCGTGLMARAIRRHVDAMHGVDLSEAMIRKAAASGCYHADHLHVAEATAHLAACLPGSFDLIVAADVLVYMSDLSQIVRLAAEALEPMGLFAFTFQVKSGGGVALGEDLRYHHGEVHLRECAEKAGLARVHAEPCITRHDGGRPVAGMVMVLMKPTP